MKKIIMIVVLCAIAWLIKLSYDFYHLSQQYTAAEQKVQQLEKQNNQFNDQIAALNRDMKKPVAAPTSQPDDDTAQIEPLTLIAQKLDLIEFALLQRQNIMAVDQLQQLDQQLELYALAPALKQSLHQVIAKDVLMVQQYAVQMLMQQNQVNDVLQKIDQQLQLALQQPKIAIAQPEKPAFWQQWFKVEKVATVSMGLEQRALLLKEAQLRLLLVRQLMNQNQHLQLQEELDQLIALLQSLPDDRSQQLLLQLEKLKQIQKLSFPQLNTRALLG